MRTTVPSSQIKDGAILDEDVAAGAAIAGTKINPSFGAQNISTTGTLGAGATTLSGDITLNNKAVKFNTNSQLTAIQGNAAASASVTYSLPVNAGANGQALITDGSGGLTWGTIATGTVFPLQAPAGSAAAASYAFSGFAGTGMYSTGVGALALSTAGTQRLAIDSSGYVMIGGASAFARLSVADSLSVRHATSSAQLFVEAMTAGSPYIVLRYSGGALATIMSDTTDNNKLKILAGGNNSITATTDGKVGILNTAPSYALDVTGDANVSGAYRIDGNVFLSNLSNANSVSLGNGAGLSASGANNIFIGGQAGAVVTTGFANTIVGGNAGHSIVGGSGNTVMGAGALGSNVSGTNNTVIGVSAGSSATAGYNCLIGYQAGTTLSTGTYNTCIGTGAGSTMIDTGSNNIVIGSGSPVIDVPASGTSNYLNIGNVIKGDMSTGHVNLTGDVTWVAPTVDHDAKGIIITGQAAVALVPGDVCYFNTSLQYAKAMANSSTTLPAVVICIDTIAANGTGRFLVAGMYKDASLGYTRGQPVYVSPTVAGLLSTIKPSTAGQFVEILGWAISSDTVMFNPNLMLVGL